MKIRNLILALALALLCSAGSAYAKKTSSDEPRVKFDHKSMGIHLNMNFKKFKTFEKLMPASMRDEIGKDYYPYLRKALVDVDATRYKDADITVDRLENGRLNLNFEFRHYYLKFLNVQWADLDELFHVYFEDK